MEAMVNYTVKAICAIKRDKSIKAIEYVANMKKTMQLTVWQTGGCSAFYRKNMTDEVTSLSPESVVNFIFTRKWFHLSDHNLLR